MIFRTIHNISKTHVAAKMMDATVAPMRSLAVQGVCGSLRARKRAHVYRLSLRAFLFILGNHPGARPELPFPMLSTPGIRI